MFFVMGDNKYRLFKEQSVNPKNWMEVGVDEWVGESIHVNPPLYICTATLYLASKNWLTYPLNNLYNMQPSENQSADESYAIDFWRTSGAM